MRSWEKQLLGGGANWRGGEDPEKGGGKRKKKKVRRGKGRRVVEGESKLERERISGEEKILE